MKRSLKKKNIIIIILCITIILLSIAFCISSIELSKYKKHNEFDVSIRSIERGTINKGGSITPTSSYQLFDNNKTAKIKYLLQQKNDLINYKIIIKNNGNIKAKIENIIVYSEEKNKNIELKNNNIKNTILKPGEEETINVQVKSKKTEKIDYSLNISILSSSEK